MPPCGRYESDNDVRIRLDGDKAIDQTITVEIVPAYIVLLDEESENPVYPNYCSSAVRTA